MTITEIAATAHERLIREDAKLLVKFLEDQWDDFAARLMPQAKDQGIDEYDMAGRICDALRAQAGMPAYKDQIF